MDDKTKKFLAKKNQPRHEAKTQKMVIKPIGKQGRPTNKDKEKKYVKLSARVPEETREAIKLALLTTHKYLGHKTQDSFIDAAVLHYLKTKAKK